ncbi:MAG TPA: MFS transporter [Pyrinomonadaceae bacterium]|nr:MFS transporter [Pyrinomonadaceae bacterium]
MSSLTYMQLLRGNRSFRLLWSGQVVSELGNWFNFIAGLGLVRAVSQAAPEATAILVVARLAPYGLFAPLAGAFVDRWSRRTLMIASDAARALFALGFLLVRGPEDLWIAYVCSVVSTLLAAFFDAAKSAAMPNVTGDEGLLAGNALLHSSRFLLMSVGAALGGAASASFGYEVAFVINALSFVVSAYSIWRIPDEDLQARHAMVESETEQKETMLDERAGDVRRAGSRLRFWRDLREGAAYTVRHPLVFALIGINMMWATGGGALNLVYDRLGGVVFANEGTLSPDAAVAALYTTVGAGLFAAMLIVRRIGAKVEMRGATAAFIGWTFIAHGVLFSLAGLMPTLWLACVLLFLSRVFAGLEFVMHDTLMMRLLPDDLRGRVISIDRAGELFVMSVSGIVAGWALYWLTPRALTVVSGLLSAFPGVVWLLLFATGRLHMTRRTASDDTTAPDDETETAALASAG